MSSRSGLTDQQKQFFLTFGFVRLPGLVKDDIAQITTGFQRVFDQNPDDIVTWIHETHENNNRLFIPQFIDRHPYLKKLKTDDRIEAINKDLIGEDVMFRGSDGNLFECGTRWHNDAYGADMSKVNIKYGLYLDQIDAGSGALRFLPGTHYFNESYSKSVRKNLKNPEANLGINDDEVPAFVYPNVPGDVIVWDYKIMHATCYAGNTRRMIAMDFSEPY